MEDGDAVLFRALPETQVYLNEQGDIVIKQIEGIEESFVFIPLGYVDALIERMCDLLKSNKG